MAGRACYTSHVTPAIVEQKEQVNVLKHAIQLLCHSLHNLLQQGERYKATQP